MRSLLRHFLQDARGNVAMMFAMFLGPLVVSVGGALDYSRTFTIGAEIQSAMDAGTLAAASLSQGEDPETIVRNYITAALSEHNGVLERLNVQVSSDLAINSREVTADAVISVPTLMLGLIGYDSLTLNRTSEANERVRNLEISLVLDISGSMSGSKITALRDAAEEFVGVMMDPDLDGLTSISVIPYNGGVRLPQAVINDLLPGTPNDTGCIELGVSDPVKMDLDANGYDWLDWQDNDQRNWRSSAFCPEDNEASLFLEETPSVVIDLIEDLDAGGNTGLDVATAWGARALDPVWRGRLGGDFPARPAAYDDPSTMKVLVVMTDGAATAQIRRAQNYYGNWYSYEIYSAAQARTNMADACDAAQAQGVHIYTIAFQVSGSTNRDLMRDCASRAVNYYAVENLDISAAFNSIAADLNNLRLAR
ncbi:pilus assembly protein TadG-related protein [Oceanicaulis sp. LC35]|uniref:TadE/TadG family type IV pilus assembly protein n=1 Tax=Oceanicaulis sp. LC35 TaxID=3349635 RepID=UPI003F84AEC9